MTGLDISRDHLIEIAVLITDGELNVVCEVRSGMSVKRTDPVRVGPKSDNQAATASDGWYER